MQHFVMIFYKTNLTQFFFSRYHHRFSFNVCLKRKFTYENFVSSKLIFNEETQKEYSNNKTSNMVVHNCKIVNENESIEKNNSSAENFQKSLKVINLSEKSMHEAISENNNDQRHIKNDCKSVSSDKDYFLQYSESTCKDLKDKNDGVNCENKLTSSASDDDLSDDTQSYLEITLQNSNELNKFNLINSSFNKRSIENNKSEVEKNLLNNSLSQIINISLNRKSTDYSNGYDSDSSESFISSPNVNKKESFFVNIHNRYAKKNIDLVGNSLPTSLESSQDFIETNYENKLCHQKLSTTSCALVNSFKNIKSPSNKNFVVPETPDYDDDDDDDNTLSDLELIEDTPIIKNIQLIHSNIKKNLNEPLEVCKTYLESENNSEDSNDSYVFQINPENDVGDEETSKDFKNKNNQITNVEVIDDVLPIESSNDEKPEFSLHDSVRKTATNETSNYYKNLINEKSSIFRELENNFINFFQRSHKLNVDSEMNKKTKENKENRSFETGNENESNFYKNKFLLNNSSFSNSEEEEEEKKNSLKNTNKNEYLRNCNLKTKKLLFNLETSNCSVENLKKSPLKRRNSSDDDDDDEIFKNYKKSKIEGKLLSIDQNIKMAAASKTNKLFGESESSEKDSWKTRHLRHSRFFNGIHDQNPRLNIAFTGFDNCNLDKIIINLGGNKTNDITKCHVLITDKVRRTIKFLCAIGLSIPITSPRWLQECKKANKFLNPWHFILKCEESEKKWNFNLETTLEKSKRQKILNGFTVFATPNVTPPVEDILGIFDFSSFIFISFA